MRIIFMGTPEFAVPSLDMLVKEGYEIVALVTQPDKPKGRGNKLTPPVTKEYAVKNGIKVLQPAKIKTQEFSEELKALKPDLFVTVAYGKIIPDYILNIPPYGCINVHGSLLPKYRGPAPIQWSVINGEKETGITTMFSDVGMDTGDMLLKKVYELPENMTYGELHDVLAIMGAEVLKDTLEKLRDGTLVRLKQEHEAATYFPMITKELGQIDWSKKAQDIHNLVRGTNPWPGAYTLYKGQKMKIWKTEIIKQNLSSPKNGTIIEVNKDGIIVAAGENLIKILEIQFDSSKRMSIEQYICGHSIDKGEILG